MLWVRDNLAYDHAFIVRARWFSLSNSGTRIFGLKQDGQDKVGFVQESSLDELIPAETSTKSVEYVIGSMVMEWREERKQREKERVCVYLCLCAFFGGRGGE